MVATGQQQIMSVLGLTLKKMSATGGPLYLMFFGPPPPVTICYIVNTEAIHKICEKSRHPSRASTHLSQHILRAKLEGSRVWTEYGPVCLLADH